MQHYKCIGEVPQGFDDIKPLNLIIGRNNAGKSTLLDLLDYATNPRDLRTPGAAGEQPIAILTGVVTNDALRRAFPEHYSGGGIPARTHWEFGKRWEGARVTWSIGPGGAARFVSIDPPFPADVPLKEQPDSIAAVMVNPFAGYRFPSQPREPAA